MKKHLSLFLLLSVCLIGIFAHDAFSAESMQYLDPDIEQRIENQYNRIEDGISSGKLTRDEARMLKNNLHHIQDETMRLQADGRLSEREKERLREMLNENNRMIQDKKQNAITDVAGVEVGHVTLISGAGKLVVGEEMG